MFMYKNSTNQPHPHDPAPLLFKPSQPPLIPASGHDYHHHRQNLTASLQQIILAAASWLRMRRSRCIFLLVCSPILLPFVCFTFPILCAVEFCIRICRRNIRRRRRRKDESGDWIRRCEEGLCDCDDGDLEEEEEEEVGLLQRYLDDQLRLVGSVAVVYDCADFDNDDHQFEDITDNFNSKTPLLA
ncbi:uncharacterized protein LOC126659937 [Mercurialis annua]|uniref:uncharacterized protein LOC126659937 n=1 Tax=Mercurialis annua TaxID=3986 RepID=UPI0021600807|nr:uncharacterized protein LOC126659937 [Mercurialis annua]